MVQQRLVGSVVRITMFLLLGVVELAKRLSVIVVNPRA